MRDFDLPHGVFFGKEKMPPEHAEKMKDLVRKLIPDNPERVKDLDLIIKLVEQSMPEAISELITSVVGNINRKPGDDKGLPVAVELLIPAFVLEGIAVAHDSMESEKLPVEAILDYWINEMVIRGFEAEYQRVAKKYNSFSPVKVVHYLSSLLRFSLKPIKKAVNEFLH